MSQRWMSCTAALCCRGQAVGQSFTSSFGRHESRFLNNALLLLQWRCVTASQLAGYCIKNLVLLTFWGQGIDLETLLGYLVMLCQLVRVSRSATRRMLECRTWQKLVHIVFFLHQLCYFLRLICLTFLIALLFFVFIVFCLPSLSYLYSSYC